ncbi:MULTISPECIES: hypothetical protein [Morganellaceae]|uniref:Uncharacterized protein n=1 Tax=Moellerella wisconsensis TaxID=158849 RepID=A0A9Q8V4W7_9GAMM|nr:hypothetical protein [Moellerella wisconsensis]UNH32525.1 hypothetical protein MNY72_15905 [Moellerella wisconsensis]
MAAPYHRSVGSPLLAGARTIQFGSHQKVFFPDYDQALVVATSMTAEHRFPMWIYKSLHNRRAGYLIAGHGSHTLEKPDSALQSNQIDQVQFKDNLPTLLESDAVRPSAVARVAIRNNEFIQCHARVSEADIVAWSMMQSDPALIFNVNPTSSPAEAKKVSNRMKSMLQNALYCQTVIRWLNSYNFIVAMRWSDDDGLSPRHKVENGWWILSAQEQCSHGVSPKCEDVQKKAKDR